MFVTFLTEKLYPIYLDVYQDLVDKEQKQIENSAKISPNPSVQR